MEIKIEIGDNLAKIIDAMLDSGHDIRVCASSIREAFGLDLTAVATQLGCHRQAIDKGYNVKIETETGKDGKKAV